MSAEPKCFFDTNILAYIASDNIEKAGISEKLLERGGSITVQVLNELINVLRRKARKSWPAARAFLDDIKPLLVIYPVTLAIHEKGLALAEKHGFQIYDAMILAAALETGCSILWSEDMQHEMVVDGRLTIRNPYQNET